MPYLFYVYFKRMYEIYQELKFKVYFFNFLFFFGNSTQLKQSIYGYFIYYFIMNYYDYIIFVEKYIIFHSQVISIIPSS